MAKPSNQRLRGPLVLSLQGDGHNVQILNEYVVLLSWLIVILRTRPDEHVSISWANRTSSDGIEEISDWKQIVAQDVLKSGQDTIRTATSAIASNCEIRRSATLADDSTDVSLVLRTNEAVLRHKKDQDKVCSDSKQDLNAGDVTVH